MLMRVGNFFAITGDNFSITVPNPPNAILNSNGRDLRGSRIYVALFPCNECAKAIIQSGIKEVIYLSDKYTGTMGNLASKRMLLAAGVNFTRMETELDQLTLNFIPEELK